MPIFLSGLTNAQMCGINDECFGMFVSNCGLSESFYYENIEEKRGDMALTAVIGNRRQLNRQLLDYAAQRAPSLIIDCANVADPHKLYPRFSLNVLQNIYVIELELLYKFRDVLRYIDEYAIECGVKDIIVTTTDHLFHYQDEVENADIYEHAWEMLKQLGCRHNIVTGITPSSLQVQLAGRFCDQIGVGHGAHSYFATAHD